MEPLPYITHPQSASAATRLVPAASRSDRTKRRFLGSLLLSTWIPMLILIYIGLRETPPFSLTQIKVVLLFLGGAHVQATLFFYTDRDFLKIVREDRARYVFVPLAMIVGSGLVFLAASSAVQAYLFLFFWAWQSYHYGRQNVGIYAFASITEGARPRKAERWALEMATYCGILGTFKILGEGVVPAYLQGPVEALYRAGFYVFMGVLIFGALAYVKNLRHSTPTRGLFYFTLLLFFLPLYLSTNLLVAFSSYAVAHGLQYLVFMTVVSAYAENKSRRTRARNLIILTGLTLLAGLACARVGDLRGVEFIKTHVALAKSLDFLVGAVFGGTLAHFVIDAGAWRLSRAAPRAFMVKRFGFIFGPGEAIRVSPPQ